MAVVDFPCLSGSPEAGGDENSFLGMISIIKPVLRAGRCLTDHQSQRAPDCGIILCDMERVVNAG